MSKLLINTVAAFFQVLLSSLFKGEKYSHTKKKKEKKRRERLGHNQAHQMFCITAQAQSSFWGWRKPKGTEDMPGCLPPPHHKVFKAPKCYTDSQILPATRSILFTVNNKAKHVLVVFQTQITVFVHLPQTQDKVPFWFKLQLTAQEKRFFYTSSSATGFLEDLEPVSLVSLQNRKVQIFL